MKRKHKIRLRELLHQLFDAKYSGADLATYSVARGKADGYMQALLDLGQASDDELLDFVNCERNRIKRPLASLHASPSSLVPAAPG